MGLRVEHEGFGPTWLSFKHIEDFAANKRGRLIYGPVATDAILESSVGEVARAQARLHPDDQFIKEVGRTVAMRKLSYQLKALGYDRDFRNAVRLAYENRFNRPAKSDGYGAGV
jgi:hypothetical protein